MSNQAMMPLPSHLIQPLANFTAGQDVVVTGFVGGCKLQGRLLALGLFPGQRLTICQNNGSSLVVSLNGSKMVLGRGVSQKVLAVAAGHCHRRDENCCCPRQDGGEQS